MFVNNGWWSQTYYDDVVLHDGPNEIQITQEIADQGHQHLEEAEVTGDDGSFPKVPPGHRQPLADGNREGVHGQADADHQNVQEIH